MIALAYDGPLDLPLYLRVSRAVSDPPLTETGRVLSNEDLVSRYEKSVKEGRALSAPAVPSTHSGSRSIGGFVYRPNFLLTLERTVEAELDWDSDLTLKFEVLRRAGGRLATFWTAPAQYDILAESDVDLFLSCARQVAAALSAEYAVGGDLHDFVDPELHRPLDTAWTIMYFGPERAKDIPIDKLPRTTRPLPTVEGGLWLYTGKNPLISFPGKETALRDLAVALGIEPRAGASA